MKPFQPIRKREYRVMRYLITNRQGEVIARYNNPSEVKTFVQASLAEGSSDDGFQSGRDEEILFDKDGEEVYRVRDTTANRA